MLRDKIVELSRELADLRSHSKTHKDSLPASPSEPPDSLTPDFKIGAASNRSHPQGGSGGQPDWPPWSTAAAGCGSRELGVRASLPGEQLLAFQDLSLNEQADV